MHTGCFGRHQARGRLLTPVLLPGSLCCPPCQGAISSPPPSSNISPTLQYTEFSPHRGSDRCQGEDLRTLSLCAPGCAVRLHPVALAECEPGPPRSPSSGPSTSGWGLGLTFNPRQEALEPGSRLGLQQSPEGPLYLPAPGHTCPLLLCALEQQRKASVCQQQPKAGAGSSEQEASRASRGPRLGVANGSPLGTEGHPTDCTTHRAG